MYPSVKKKKISPQETPEENKGQFLRVRVWARVYSMYVTECVVLFAYFSLCVLWNEDAETELICLLYGVRRM